MEWFSQTGAVIALNLRTIPARLSSSAVAIIGIAGVVVVFVSVLSIAAGFTAAMQGSGSPSRALVMRSGADSEMTSGLEGTDIDVIAAADYPAATCLPTGWTLTLRSITPSFS